MPFAIRAGGKNVSILRNQFLNVGYAVNMNGLPKGALVVDNVAPSRTGIRDYFVWAAGQDVVVANNVVANSTREHILRISNVDRITVANNDFTNLDRTSNGDQYDTAKGAIVIQMGQYAYVYGNKANGPAGVGPLGQGDGLANAQNRFKFAVIESNQFNGGTFNVHHGAENVRVQRNVFEANDITAINVEGWNGTYQRGVRNLVIDSNVGINESTRGVFVKVYGKVDGTFELTNNTLVAPNLQYGAYGTAAVYVNASHLNWFSRISGNTWPTGGSGLAYAEGGVHFVGTSMSKAGYQNASEWNAFGTVSNDVFVNLPLTTVLANYGYMGIT
jgi:hypothetical protein